MNVVVVYGTLVLEGCERVGLSNSDALERAENRAGNWPIDHSTTHGSLQNGIAEQVHIVGKCTLRRDLGEHGKSPRIAPQQPIALVRGKRTKLFITSHSFIK